MLAKIKQWVDERWPLSPLVHLALDEEIPGGARYAYTLGSAVLIVFMIQAVTGIMQLFFYVPTTDHAYDSISYLRTMVPFGWLAHGLHYWGAQLMIILLLFHIARVFLWGAYKKPRELTWIAGVALFLTAMGFSFTGGPLHWDQRGFWVGEVSTSIAGTVPLVGDLTKKLLRGGEEMGQLALSRLFVIHVAVLPGALLALFGIHIIAMRRFGSVGPWNEEARMRKGPFWPDQAFKDAVAGSAVFLLIIILAVLLPPQYSGMADPLDVSYIPKPEWNFLFLYESLKYFHGRLEPVGTVGIPTVLILMVILLPFIDRNPERNPLKRPIAMLCALVLGSVIVAISVIGYLSPGFAEAPVKPATTLPKGTSALASLGKTFSVAASEAAKPVAARPSPPATDSPGSKASPEAEAAEGKGIPGKAAYVIGSAVRGADVFRKNCSSCHGPEGVTTVPNPGSTDGKVPNLSPIDREDYRPEAQAFAEIIDRYIQHGSVPAGPNPAIRMPAFGDSHTLTQQEIANVEAYVLQLNGVDRAQIVNPGMQPRRFLLLIAAVYGVIILVLGGIWNKRSGPQG